MLSKDHAKIKPLAFDSQSYMDAHLNFRNNLTNQGQLMQDALYDAILRRIKEKGLVHLRLASIGSGTGIIDAPLVARLAAHLPVQYVGIDPNIYEIAMAKENFMAQGINDAVFHHNLIENVDLGALGQFDVVIMVHVTYYSADIAPMLSAANHMIGANGLLLNIASTDNPQNQLFVETTRAIHGHTPTLAGDYVAGVVALDHDYWQQEINARILLDDYFADPSSDASWQFLDFFLHADSRSIRDGLIARYRQTIEAASVTTDEGIILPHIATLTGSMRA